MGTVTGGGLSILATIVTQRQQQRAARKLVVDQKADEAADKAIETLWLIKRHLENPLPPRSPIERRREWDSTLATHVRELRPFLLRLPNKKLRRRLDEIAGYLKDIDVTQEHTWGGHSSLGTNLCDHALACLGAFVRSDSIPRIDQSMKTARSAHDAWERYLHTQRIESGEAPPGSQPPRRRPNT